MTDIVTTRKSVLLIALLLGLTTASGSPPAASARDEIVIVAEPRPSAVAGIDLGREFGTEACSTRRAGRTIRDVLLPEAKTIVIHRYAPDWRDAATVTTYIERVLDAEPEGRMLSPRVHWAEARSAEILGSVELANGTRRLFHLANGYAHFEDAAGCEWWARYLGPDRSKWVVRP